MNVFKLFPTTVIEFDLRGYNNKNWLLNYIENYNAIDHGLINKGKSSYGKDDILFHPQCMGLLNKIQDCIDKYNNYLKLPLPTIISNSWFNIISNQGKVELHHHESAPISGAYYPLLQKDTCNLIFKSPVYSAVVYYDVPNSSNYQKTFQMPIKQDHLYLFPGFLEHQTEVNKGEKRIVLSFNARYKI